MPNGRPSLFATLLPAILVCALTVLVLLVAPSIVSTLRHRQTVNQVQAAGVRLAATNPGENGGNIEGGILAEMSRATRDLADFVRPSVVHLTGMQAASVRGGRRSVTVGVSTGSGWLWDDAGHIVTNFHVIDGMEELEVQLYDGEIRAATVIGADPSTDIAVLKIEGGRLIPATRRSSGEQVEQGELCFAFGSPFDLRFSMSSGIVSGLGRAVSIRPFGFENFIQVDAAINPGNSGGPLTDHMGRVIGMNTAIATNELEPQRQQFAGIGLAIPLDMIESVVQQVVKSGTIRKGFLGVTVLDQGDPIGAWLVQQGFRGRGVLVSDIEPDHPALVAGLHVGDVVTRYDGAPVSNIEAITALVRADVDRDSQLRIWRGTTSGPTWLELKWTRGGPTLGGLAFHGLGDRLGEYHRAMGCAGQGVLLSLVQPGKPADQAGLAAGDIILTVNGLQVRTVRQLQSRISSLQPGTLAKLEVWRYDPEVGAGGLLHVDVELARLGGEF